MIDEKYIVFKRDDYDHHTVGEGYYYHAPMALSDAVVIRKQDIFASPALYSYAHSIALAAKILTSAGMDEVTQQKAKELFGIADYFAQQAYEATENVNSKLPD